LELVNIRTLSADDLKSSLISLGQPAFRASQVYHWLWGQYVLDFSEMSNIGKAMQEVLTQNFISQKTKITQLQKSQDETIKVGFETYDGHAIEGVLIPTDSRVTICISSQIGCSLACTFCATGLMKRVRNLFAFEIYDQVKLMQELALQHYKRPITNIVYMGMGEPLLNLDEVVKSIFLLHDEAHGLNFSYKRITISTSGIVRGIQKLTELKIPINLALSLHAPNNALRTQIMDINKSNPLEEVVEALDSFYNLTQNKISFEYVLLRGINDSLEQAAELVALCRKVPAFVNIIEFNRVEGISYSKSDTPTKTSFVTYLREKGITCKIRRSRGKDIDAACGQLANKLNNVNLIS
jgi:23S rRNA (adenine2503-C2)-methyltransferase